MGLHKCWKDKKRFQLLTVGLLIVLACIASWFNSPQKILITISEVHTGVLVFLIPILYITRPFLIIPLSAFSIFMGYRFGMILGIPIAITGTVLSCLPPFTVARYLCIDSDLLGRISKRSEEFFDTTGGVRGMVAARLSPAPADAVSYGAGFSGVSLSSFVFGTVLGELPWATAYVLIGSSMRSFTLRSVQLDRRLIGAGAVVAFLLLIEPIQNYLQS